MSSYGANVQVVCRTQSNGVLTDPQGFARMPATFSDGTSNTILFAEKYARCINMNYPEGGSYWAYYFTGVNLKPYHPGFAISWNGYSIGPGSMFQVRPNPFNGMCDPTLAATPHSAGIHVGLADGSVRFLTQNVTSYTWWHLCTPAGGEIVSDAW